MAGANDFGLKFLFSIAAQGFVDWLLPGATFCNSVLTKLLVSDEKHLEADALLCVQINGEKMLLHVEFQTAADTKMERRMWEYNALAALQNDLPVLSVVIYLKKCRAAISPYSLLLPTGREVQRFSFDAFRMCDVETEEFSRRCVPGMLPLLPLTAAGGRHEIVEQVLTALDAAPLSREIRGILGFITYTLACLIWEESDKRWLKERFNMPDVIDERLMASWGYREVVERLQAMGIEKGLQKGLQEGLQEGLQKGLQEGRLQVERRMLLDLVQLRFPECRALAQEAAETTADSEKLHNIVLKVCVAQNEEEVRSLLASFCGTQH